MKDELQSRLERLQRQTRSDPETVPIEPLERALQVETESIRDRALTVTYTISLTQPDRVRTLVPQLVSLLESDRATIRTKAALTLGNVAETSPGPVSPHANRLVERLDDQSASTTRSAIGALRQIAANDPTAVVDAVPRVTSLLQAESEETRRDAAAVLEAVSDDHPADVIESTDALLALLTDPHRTPTEITYDPNATNDKSSATEQMGGYQTLVSDRGGRAANVRAREAAARTLASVTPEETALATEALEPHYPSLFGLLEDYNPMIRASVAGVLAYLAEDTPEAIQPAEETLIESLDGPVTVAGNAVWALRFIGTDRAVSALTDVLERDDIDPAVVRTAEEAIDALADERADCDDVGGAQP
ncbi:HEAT repeat domain-containing protein [Natronosalvus vescus]|uniref:HEAT repeat domain-containing protein n=1 Tax=Natronosalvus vescus TaxID=2953881 RepID=UPI002090FB2E|nr:HEAT repeat domain-containing protein [Natronosalvus vescus]